MGKRGVRRLSALMLILLALTACAGQEEDPLAAYDGTWYFFKNAVACEFGDRKIYRDDYTAEAGQTLAGIYFDAGDHIEANLANTGGVHLTRELYIVSTEDGDVLCDDPEGEGTVYFYRDAVAAMAAVEEAQAGDSAEPEPDRVLPVETDTTQEPKGGDPSPAPTPAETETDAPSVRGGGQTLSEPAAQTEPPRQVTEPDASGGKVWIPQSGSKYHRAADCSGMKDPRQVTLSEAEAQGATPCSRCY